VTISAILNDCISLSLGSSPDEIVEEEDDVRVTRPTALMDDDMISEEGIEGPASDDEEILEFPEDEYDAMDLDIDLDGVPDLVVPDVVVPDVVMPDVVMPDLDSNATVKVTQVGVPNNECGVSMLIRAYRIVRGVL